IEILKGIRHPYEEHHSLRISDEAIEAAAQLSARYVPDRFLPDKAIDLVDESAARVRMYKSPEALRVRKAQEELDEVKMKMEEAAEGEAKTILTRRQGELEELLEQVRQQWNSAGEAEVNAEDIAEVISMWTGIPVTRIAGEESARLLEMEDALHKRIIGQREAIDAISKAVRRARAGLKDPRRPVGSFIFLGPTGVGKTEL